jgi:TRAP-type C4-dicarboxylate transport system permease small subunit
MAQHQILPHDAGLAGEAVPRRSFIAALESALGSAVELAAAALVAIEIVLLFAGVVARYVFNRPIVWSDELASILFLWLAMLGAVIAFRRGEHMRMTAVVGLLSTSTRAVLDVFATSAALAFLAIIVWPSLQYAQDEAFITTPALEITNAWRAAALPVGIALMAIFGVLRLARTESLRTLAIGLGSALVLVGLFWFWEPVFRQLGNLNLLIFLSA